MYPLASQCCSSRDDAIEGARRETAPAQVVTREAQRRETRCAQVSAARGDAGTGSSELTGQPAGRPPLFLAAFGLERGAGAAERAEIRDSVPHVGLFPRVLRDARARRNEVAWAGASGQGEARRPHDGDGRKSRLQSLGSRAALQCTWPTAAGRWRGVAQPRLDFCGDLLVPSATQDPQENPHVVAPGLRPLWAQEAQGDLEENPRFLGPWALSWPTSSSS